MENTTAPHPDPLDANDILDEMETWQNLVIDWEIVVGDRIADVRKALEALLLAGVELDRARQHRHALFIQALGRFIECLKETSRGEACRARKPEQASS